MIKLKKAICWPWISGLLLVVSSSLTAQVTVSTSTAVDVVGGTVELGIYGNLIFQEELSNSGSILLTGDWTNADEYIPSATSKVSLVGTTDQTVDQSSTLIQEFHTLEVDKSGGLVLLESSASVQESLNLTNGKVALTGGVLGMQNNATVNGESSTNYVIANQGFPMRFQVSGYGTVDFPVGDDTEYTPLQFDLTDGLIGADAAIGCQVMDWADPSVVAASGTAPYLNRQWLMDRNDITIDAQNPVVEYDLQADFVTGDPSATGGMDNIHIPDANTPSATVGNATSTMLNINNLQQEEGLGIYTAGNGCTIPVSISYSETRGGYCDQTAAVPSANPTLTIQFEGDDDLSNFTITWSDGTTGSLSTTVTTAGTYTVEVNDGQCIGVASYEVMPVALPSMQTYKPLHYWTFEGADPLKSIISPNEVYTDLGLGSGASSGAVDGLVGQYFDVKQNNDAIPGGSFSVPAIRQQTTLEMLFRFNGNFDGSRGWFALTNASADYIFPFLNDYSIGAAMGVTDAFGVRRQVSFSNLAWGSGLQNLGYYVDGGWHHLALVANAQTGELTMYLDGMTTPDFHVQDPAAVGSELFPFNEQAPMTVKTFVNGQIDELAVFDEALPATMIYQHYQDALAGNQYSEIDNTTICQIEEPPLSTYPAVGPWNDLDYTKGWEDPCANGTNQLEQIQNYPLPRYKPGHALHRNVPWYDHTYLAGGGTSCESFSAADRMDQYENLQVELARNWHQYLTFQNLNSGVNIESFQGDPTEKYLPRFVSMVEQNPDLPVAGLTFWAQAFASFWSVQGPSSTEIATLPFINNISLQGPTGNNNTYYEEVDGKTVWRSDLPETDVVRYDGMLERRMVDNFMRYLDRPFDIVNENGELDNPRIHLDAPPFTNGSGTFSTADKNNNFSGDTWHQYTSKRRHDYRETYMNEITSHPALGNTEFTWYAVDGKGGHTRMLYEEAVDIATGFGPINGTGLDRHYSTMDVYCYRPFIWRHSLGPRHGLDWVWDARDAELSLSNPTRNNKLFSPFVTAGWSRQTDNMRPTQFLGMMKLLSVYGAEFFYLGYFNINQPFADPRRWAWQTIMPTYAQAVTSRFEDVLFEGDVLKVNNAYQFQFPTNSYMDALAVRKLTVSSTDKYVISGTVQVQTNADDGQTPAIKDVDIEMDGLDLTFEIRRQGSTYYLERDQGEVLFYQLDGWHDYGHPDHWSRDFHLQAELWDAQGGTNWDLTTEDGSGDDYDPMDTEYDFTDAMTYLSCNSTTPVYGQDYVGYRFSPRSESQNTTFDYDVWIRARATAGNTSGLYLSVIDVATDKTVYSDYMGCIDATGWQWWHTFGGCGDAVLAGLTNGTYELRITPEDNNLLLDEIVLKDVSNGTFAGGPPPVTSCTLTLPALQADFSWDSNCDGDVNFHGWTSYQSDCQNAYTYRWTVDADPPVLSSQDPTFNLSAGSHTVLFEVLEQGQTTPVITVSHAITINALPTVTMTVPSAPVCADAAAALTAQPGTAGTYTYAWSPVARVDDATQQNVTATPYEEEVFTVVLTDANGCTAAAAETLDVHTPINAEIISEPAVMPCNGGAFLTNNEFEVSPCNNNFTYTWSWETMSSTTPGLTPINGGCTVAVTGAVDASYLLNVAVEDDNGCVENTQAMVYVEESCSTKAGQPFEEESVEEEENVLVAYPNPFRETVNLEYYLAEDATVNLSVYSMLGVKVEELVSSAQNAGVHRYTFDAPGRGSGSGVYMVRLQINSEVITKRIVAF